MSHVFLSAVKIYRANRHVPSREMSPIQTIREGYVYCVDADGNWFQLREEHDVYRCKYKSDQPYSSYRDSWKLCAEAAYPSLRLQIFQNGSMNGDLTIIGEYVSKTA